MHRIAVPPDALEGDRAVLPPAQAHHVADVLRLRPGERIVLFDGSGTDYVVELTEVRRGEAAGRIVERRAGMPAALRLLLVQGVPRGQKMDLIVRMGTEVGIAAFLPALTSRSLAPPGPARLQRWRRIAAAAAAQSGRSTVPAVEPARPLEEIWPLLGGALVLMPWEGERAQSIAEALAGTPRPAAVALLVGPEGGWADDEVESARAHGARTVSLGPLTLRTETAGLVGAAMVLYEVVLRAGPVIGPGRA